MLELSACCLASGVKELYIYEMVKNIPPGKVRPGRGSRKHIWPQGLCWPSLVFFSTAKTHYALLSYFLTSFDKELLYFTLFTLKIFMF